MILLYGQLIPDLILFRGQDHADAAKHSCTAQVESKGLGAQGEMAWRLMVT